MLWFVDGRDEEERRAQRAEARGPVMKLHNADNKTKLTLVFPPPPPAHQLYVTSRDFHAAPLCAPVKQRGRCSLSLTRCCEQVIYCRSRRYDVLVLYLHFTQCK